MSNGARHVLGLIAGIVATVLIAAALVYFADRQRILARTYDFNTQRWYLLGLLIGAGVVAGVIAGSRISPLASLVPGLALGTLGGMHLVMQNFTGDVDLLKTLGLSARLRSDYSIMMGTGYFLLIGAALLVSSVFPSRWRARVPSSTGRHSFDYTPDYAGDAGGPPPLDSYGRPPSFGHEQPAYGGQYEQQGYDRPYGGGYDEPERPGWASPPPGPPPLNSP